jgi:Xaa-Pro aminopeptidase
MDGQGVPGYSLGERDRRWAIARSVMAAEGVDALIVYGEHECTGVAPFAPDVYFTNDRPGAMVVFAGNSDPVSLVRVPAFICDHIEAVRRSEQVWIKPQNMRLGLNTAGVVDLLRELGLERSSIGVIGLDPCPPFHFNAIMPYGLWSGVLSQLPLARFTSAWTSFVLRTLRQSDEELAVLTHGARIGEAMAKVMARAARPGVTEAHVHAAAMNEAYERGAAAPGMLLASGPGFISWGPPAWSYRPQPPRIIEEGDVILAELFSTFGMRETQHQVAIAVGAIHADLERAAVVARAAYEVALEMLRPGNTFGEVVAAMEHTLKDGGGWIVHPFVHGLNPWAAASGFGTGLKAHARNLGYGRLEHVPTAGADLLLAPGMTFSVEPNCAFGGRMMHLGGTVVLTETGPLELGAATARVMRVSPACPAT